MNRYGILLLISFSYFYGMDNLDNKYDERATNKLVRQLERIKCSVDSRGVDGFIEGFDAASPLILTGANPNIIVYPENGESSLLMYAVRFNRVVEATFLLDHGADPNFSSIYRSPLNVAVRNNAQACVELLVKRGVDINKEIGKETIICIAVKGGSASLIEYLLQSGADMHADGQWGSAWVRAATCNLEGFKLLLKYNTQIYTNASANIAALHGAAGSGNGCHDEMCSIAELLLAYGTPVNGRNIKGESALLRAIFWPHKIKMVKFLLSNGADANNSSNDQTTPLIRAARYGSAQIIQDLLDAGADQSMMNKDGKRAVDIAIEQERNAVIPLLQKKKIV